VIPRPGRVKARFTPASISVSTTRSLVFAIPRSFLISTIGEALCYNT
jgi:hypothetical protein